MEELKITGGTIARTIVLAIAIVNQILVATGHSILPIEEAQVTEIISTLFTIITALISWWKNNSFTKAAIAGDAVMREKKLEDLADRIEKDV